MATNRHRVTAYVDEETALVLGQTADALDQTRSSLAAEVLSNAVPVLEVLRDLALDLKSAPDKHREFLADFADSLRPLQSDFDRRLAVVSSRGEDPRRTNRGVRNHDLS